jgi:hypothetical protein
VVANSCTVGGCQGIRELRGRRQDQLPVSNLNTMFMQRLALFSFLGVIVLLLAFTAHETKKPDLSARTCNVKGRP